MPALVGVTSADGVVLFEGAYSEAALEEIAISDRVEDVVSAAQSSVATMADAIRSCAGGLVAGLEAMAAEATGPALKEAVVELGVSVTGEGNAFVVKGSAEANLKVTLTWQFG